MPDLARGMDSSRGIAGITGVELPRAELLRCEAAAGCIFLPRHLIILK
jgi:hypothetical protein